MTDNILIKGIMEEASAKAGELLSKARSQADAIISEAGKKADKVRSAEEAKRKERLEMLKDTEAKAIEGLDRVYSLRHEENAVDKVMKLVDSAIRERLDDDEVRCALLADLITEAALAVGTPQVIICSSDSVSDEMLRECEARLLRDYEARIAIERGSAKLSSFGVIATDPEGRIIYDDTISTRISRRMREIRHIVGEAACRKE